MRRGGLGIIIVLIIFTALVGALYYIYVNYSKTPNELTRKTANSIYKYPKAGAWEVTEAKNICLFSTDGCNQPIRILFDTPDEWGAIYNYYTSYMKQYGWSTNTQVITSLPSTVVFTKGKCEAVLANHNELKYSFTITCSD